MPVRKRACDLNAWNYWRLKGGGIGISHTYLHPAHIAFTLERFADRAR
jgi:hypothetical protein